MSSALIRLDPSVGRFTIIGNDMANDSRLSLEARGLALFLLSKPADFSIRVTALPLLLKEQPSARGHVGRERVRKMLRQLQEAGYLSRECKRDARGHWTWDFVLRGFALPVVQKPVDGYSRNGSSVDGASGDKEQNTKSKDRNKKNKQEMSSKAGASVSRLDSLVFDVPFTAVTEREARGLLLGCLVAHRQAVIDEVVWIFRKGKLRGSPCGLLRRLIERANAGTFSPNAPTQTHVAQLAKDSRTPLVSASSDVASSSSTEASRRIVDEIRRSLRPVSGRP